MPESRTWCLWTDNHQDRSGPVLEITVASLLSSLQQSFWICLCSQLHNSSVPFYQRFPCEFMMAIHSMGSNHSNFCTRRWHVYTLYSCSVWMWDKARCTDISEPTCDIRKETLESILSCFLWCLWECLHEGHQCFFTKLLHLLSKQQNSAWMKSIYFTYSIYNMTDQKLWCSITLQHRAGWQINVIIFQWHYHDKVI